jgi:LPXTG-motif cell wall-anchored protein
MKHTPKKIAAILLTLVLAMVLLPPVTVTAASTGEFDISTGEWISGLSAACTWAAGPGSTSVLTVGDGAYITVTGEAHVNDRRIEVAENATATIVLDGVSIRYWRDFARGPLLLKDGAKLTLIIADGSTNDFIISDGRSNGYGAGIQVSDGATLVIQGGAVGDGVLNASGCIAGIGAGSPNNAGGTIIITGGIITAAGSTGIGGGIDGVVMISGGVVTANGWGDCAGIGGGPYCTGGKIIINGSADVTAAGGEGTGAGIGCGYSGTGVEITIGGDANVVARGGNFGGAGIGGSSRSSSGNIVITGNANVTATASATGAGIGSGGKTVDSIYIDTAGFVDASGGGEPDMSKYPDLSYSPYFPGAAIGYGGAVIGNETGGEGVGFMIDPAAGHPEDKTALEGENAEFAVEVIHTPGESAVPYNSQWQKSTDGGDNWSDLPGETANTLTLKDIAVGMSGNLYRCVLKDAAFSGEKITIVSHAALLTVTEDPSITYGILKSFDTFTGSGDSVGKIDADDGKFTRLTLKDKEVDADNYSVAHGSTVITLKESYLKTLANGTYTFRAEFTDGYSDITLTVKKAVVQSANPKTGDDSDIVVWMGVCAMALTAMAGGTAIVYQKRKRAGK